MSWCPFATKRELQPESDTQASITPTQFILHSVIAPWTELRIYEFWRDSTNLESHFGLGYAGDLGQYIGTQTRADANAGANRRADGTGAVSMETASNTSGTDPWTADQLEKIVQVGVWLHETHGIPLRKCRTHDDPGYGYHRMFSQWSTSGTACPGNARVAQFDSYVLPEIIRRCTAPTPPEEEVIEVLNSPNAIDVNLATSATEFTPLAFADTQGLGPDVILGGDYKHSTNVHLLFDPYTHVDTVIEGRFYLTNQDDISGKSNFLPERYLGGGGHVFTNAGYVPADKHLHFEVRVQTPDNQGTVLLQHRLATGLYVAANPVG